MSTTRTVESAAMHEYCDDLTKKIYQPLQELEEMILAGHTDESCLAKLKPNYSDQLMKTVKLLRSVSANIFLNLNIQSHSSEFSTYLNVFDHLTSLVVVSIFRNNQIELSILAMERWICILKHSYENADFFTAGAIVNALSKFEMKIAGTHLSSRLSSTARGILEYYQNIFNLEEERIHKLQLAHFNQNKKVIPLIASVAHTFNQTIPQIEKLERDKTLDVTLYLKMQKSLDHEELNAGKSLADQFILPWDDQLKISISADDKEVISSAVNDWEYKIDMEILSSVLKFYTQPDYYYVCRRFLSVCISKLDELVSEYQDNKTLNQFIIKIKDNLINPTISTDSKFSFMQKVIELNKHVQLSQICQIILVTLSSLSRYDRVSELEPDIHPIDVDLSLSTLEEEQSTKEFSKTRNQFEFFSKKQSEATVSPEINPCLTKGMNGQNSQQNR